MKKFISFFLIISFFMAVTAFSMINQSSAEINLATTTNQVKLEKILSPQHINFYQKIKKVGNTLWGIKKADKEREKAEINFATTTSQVELEKIPSLQHINFYGKIKKVGNALWGIRKKMLYQVATSTAPCVITAIETKDKALTENNTNTTNDLNKAIASRTTCQKTALGLTINQKQALDECVRIFKEAHKQIKKNSYKTHQNIRKTYLDDLKICSKTALSGMATSTVVYTAQEFSIEDGGGNIIETLEDNN